MKLKKLFVILISITVLAAVLINTAGCGLLTPRQEPKEQKQEVTGEMKNLMTGYTSKAEIKNKELTEAQKDGLADFAVELLKRNYEKGGNTLISSMSVLSALAMAAGGAKGETLAQMEEVMGFSVEELQKDFAAYLRTLPQGKNYKLSLANSIWLKDDENFTPVPEFLQRNADSFNAEILSAPFNNATLADINKWVNTNTDGMIPKVIEKIDEENIAYLINALAFNAKWEDPYTESSQIREQEFTKEDGTTQPVTLMHSNEYAYIEDENAVGVIKYYEDRQYAFAALLPKEGLSVEDYIKTLDGGKLRKMLSGAQDTKVITAIPKFETEFSTDMSDRLREMGMTDAFNVDLADFSGMGSYKDKNIFISAVIHKTFISVAEDGTKAGAVTAIPMAADAAAPQEPPKQVILDRPFVYMLIDCTTDTPFFMGALEDVG